jgi:hypothetical protein
MNKEMIEMPTEYGFGRHANTDEEKKFWKDKYDNLTEYEKAIFNGGLMGMPGFLMTIGIDHISNDTIPEILLRMTEMRYNFFDDTFIDKEYAGSVKKLLERFIGYETNVGFDTISSFIECHTRHMRAVSKFTTKKQIDKEWQDWFKERKYMTGVYAKDVNDELLAVGDKVKAMSTYPCIANPGNAIKRGEILTIEKIIFDTSFPSRTGDTLSNGEYTLLFTDIPDIYGPYMANDFKKVKQ